MKIALGTLDLSLYQRMAIAHHIGKDRPATRSEARALVDALISAWLEDLDADYQRAEENEE